MFKEMKMDIVKYMAFFHNGGIINIKHENPNRIEVSMESSELIPEWNEDNIPLSDSRRIRGKLYIDRVESIMINDKLEDSIKIIFDFGEISNFEINDNEVKLYISWCSFPPKKDDSKFERIIIKAEEIYWENIPNLFNPMD